MGVCQDMYSCYQIIAILFLYSSCQSSIVFTSYKIIIDCQGHLRSSLSSWGKANHMRDGPLHLYLIFFYKEGQGVLAKDCESQWEWEGLSRPHEDFKSIWTPPVSKQDGNRHFHFIYIYLYIKVQVSSVAENCKWNEMGIIGQQSCSCASSRYFVIATVATQYEETIWSFDRGKHRFLKQEMMSQIILKASKRLLHAGNP